MQRVLSCLTIALLAVGLCGNHCFAGALEDSLTAPAQHDACTGEFASLREAAEARGRLIKAASERHAAPVEACELIGNYGQSEIRLIQYLEANMVRCGFPTRIAEQIRAGHNNTEAMLTKVCAAVPPAARGGPARPVGDFDNINTTPLVR